MSNDRGDPVHNPDSSQHNAEPTLDQVLNLLDFEINRLTLEQQRPGWTLWAIYGGLATTVWLLFDQWEKGGFNLTNTLQLFLVVWSLPGGTTVFRFLDENPVSWRQTAFRFRFASELYKKRSHFFSMIRSLALGLIALFVSKGVWWPQVSIVVFFHLATFIIAAVLFAYSFSESLTVTTTPRKRARKEVVIGSITEALFFLLMMWGISGYLFAVIYRYPTNLSIVDLRVCGLLVVLSFLLSKFMWEAKPSPLLTVLIEIRRDLVFGRLTTAEAIRQADISFTGRSVLDYLKDDYFTLITLADEIAAKDKAAFSIINSLELNLTDSQDEDMVIAEAKITYIRRLKENFDEVLAERTALIKGYKEQIDKFEKRAGRINWGLPVPDMTLEVMRNNNSSTISTISERNRELTRRYEQIQALISIIESNNHQNDYHPSS